VGVRLVKNGGSITKNLQKIYILSGKFTDIAEVGVQPKKSLLENIFFKKNFFS
jgi:hypothetical protein